MFYGRYLRQFRIRKFAQFDSTPGYLQISKSYHSISRKWNRAENPQPLKTKFSLKYKINFTLHIHPFIHSVSHIAYPYSHYFQHRILRSYCVETKQTQLSEWVEWYGYFHFHSIILERLSARFLYATPDSRQKSEQSNGNFFSSHFSQRKFQLIRSYVWAMWSGFGLELTELWSHS